MSLPAGRVAIKDLFYFHPCRPDLSKIPGDRQPFTLYKVRAKICPLCPPLESPYHPLKAPRLFVVEVLAVAASSFREVVLLDAGLVLFTPPKNLLHRLDYQAAANGLLLFRDYWPELAVDQAAAGARLFGVPWRPDDPRRFSGYAPSYPDAIDSSLVVMDKRTHRGGAALCRQVNFVLGGAGGGALAGDKDTWLFAAVAENKSSCAAVNPRKSGFFVRAWRGPTDYTPIWGHL